MKVGGSVALVTGANRGIGQAFARELLSRGASKIYITARNPATLSDLLSTKDSRLVPLALDVTSEARIEAVAKMVTDVTLLINNAGAAGFHGAMSAIDLAAARREMDVNYFGQLAMIRAFERTIASSGEGAIVNMLSFLSLVTLPAQGTYSASKSAALAMTRSVRAELASKGILVVASMPVQVDTDMGRYMPEPKLSPSVVAKETLDAVEQRLNEVFPGELSRQASEAFASDPKALQATLAQNIPRR